MPREDWPDSVNRYDYECDTMVVRDLLRALCKVQLALACDRDGEPIPGGLCLEEVKYMVVDQAIADATGEEQ